MADNNAAKPLKIGIICEGQVDGADEKVFKKAIGLLCPRASVDIVPSGNRPQLLTSAAKQAKNLLEQGCSAVFVIWDVFPDWPDHGGTTDCKMHRKTLMENLASAGMKGKPIVPIAIREELEAWLLADGDALSAAMSTRSHKIKVKHEKKPDMISKPKGKLRKLFETKKVGTYNESIHAGKVAANWTTTARLERSQSFKRLADTVRSLCKSS